MMVSVLVEAADAFTLTGDCDIDGAITVTSGTVDVDGVFDATGGLVTFTGAGELIADSTVISLGTLSTANGTVTYNGDTAQTIVAGAYPSLKASDAAGTKTLGGAVTVAGALTIDAGVTVAMGANTLAVTGASNIDGTLDVAGSTLTLTGASAVGGAITVTTGTVDANGTFDASGGAVTFTGAGNLNLSGVVASLGALTDSDFGTVTYDANGAQDIVLDEYVNLIAGGGAGTKTLGGTVTVSGAFTTNASVTTAMGGNNLTVAGATVINGAVTITTATLDANGSFDATGGTITITGAGNLNLEGVVTSLGALSDGAGTVTYDANGDQTILKDDYYSLIAGGGAGIKTLADTVNVAGDFTTDASVTTAMGANNLTVAGLTDIDGTITISTATLDANGAFDATGGTITFSGAGNLNLASTVTDLGTLSDNFGTVTYDGVDQEVLTDIYNNIVIGGSSGTKTLAGAITVNSNLTVSVGVTFDVTSSGDYSVSVAGSLENNGTFSAREGTVTFNGSDDQIFTPGSSSYYNIILNNAGGDDKLLTIAGNLVINNDLTLTDGTLDFDTNDPDISIAGDLTIADAAVWTKGSGTATFNGATQSLSDGNTTPNDLGLCYNRSCFLV